MEATKFNPNSVGYGMASNAIIAVTVNKVDAEETATTPEEVTNSCTDKAGNSYTFTDAQLFDSPQNLANSLVTAYEAANPAIDPAPVAAGPVAP